MTSAFPERVAGRPVWLLTLADLALLLVGFFVLLQARQLDRHALASGLRAGFAAPAPPVAPMPVAAAGLLDFAPGSAALASSPAATVAWARASASDPRVVLTVTGTADGSRADVDTATGSGAVLAADRARALAAALATAGIAPGRLVITTSRARRPGIQQGNTLPGSRRAAIVTLGFSGSRP